MPFNEHFLNTATKITSVETRNIQENFIEFMDTLQAVESPTGKTPPLTLKVTRTVCAFCPNVLTILISWTSWTNQLVYAFCRSEPF